ncbi:MAG: glycosyltransferase, partial [Methanobrevibacter sp.]|nr:glycosyltransferase [Methanobrevibacter sp.]
KKENRGLASSANLGIKYANGEYVILVDDDDIVPPYAYEKLYNKAKEVDADISIGQAVLLHGSWQHEINSEEQRVWEKERVIEDISEFPTLFHDAFYWNKIIKRSLLVEHNIRLPDGMVYADRKYAHTAFIYANRISIIPDCVYLWRIRKNDKADESLSNRRRESWNYINRIDSYEFELDLIREKFPNYFKILMRRVIIPIKGILDNKEFENAFFNRGVKLLKEECLKIDDLWDNDLGNLNNILIYLILNDYKRDLFNLLKLNITHQRRIFNGDGKSYWKLPLFRHSMVKIPDELFEIKYMIPQYLTIAKIHLTDSFISFEGIELPKYLNFRDCEIVFIGRTHYDDNLANNYYKFKMDDIDGEDNLYDLRIPIQNFRVFELYDVFFRVNYDDNLYDQFRLSNEVIDEIVNDSEDVAIFQTAYNNLSVAVQNFHKNFTIKADENKLYLLIDNPDKIKQYIKVKIKDLKTSEETFMTLDEENLSKFYIDWNFFLDRKSKYALNFLTYTDDGVFNKLLEINTKHLTEFENISVKNNDNVKIKITTDKNSNIVLKSR